MLKVAGKSNNMTRIRRKLPIASFDIGLFVYIAQLFIHLYLLSSLLRTLILWIQSSFWLVLALAVPFLLPKPL